MPACISIKNITKRYGKTLALDGLSLDIESGEVLGLLGPNGAGKSTTLSILAGLVHPDSGSVSFFGKDLRRNYLEISARTGHLLERPAFYEYLTARRNLKIQARLALKEVNIDRALDMVGLLHVGGTRVRRLSQGMRQRLGIAQALLTEPEVLVLDEPTSGLDIESSQEILQTLATLASAAGVTIVFSSHMMQEVENLCHRVAFLNQGRLVACDKTETLLSFDQTKAEVLLEGAEGAAKRLTDQAWVEQVEVRPGRLLVKLKEPNTHQLTSFLVNAGYKVSGVLPRRRTLKDHFLRLMNSPKKEQAS